VSFQVSAVQQDVVELQAMPCSDTNTLYKAVLQRSATPIRLLVRTPPLEDQADSPMGMQGTTRQIRPAP
jgi:hypothetical protein